MINKETFEKLQKYEKHLQRGYYGEYIFGLFEKDFDEMYEIYKELGGKERLKYSCTTCCLRLTKFLGKLYYEYKQNPPKEEVVEEEVVTKKETKKKKTTKK